MSSDEDTHVRYTVSRQAQGKACNKNTTCLRATSHEWIYIRVPARASKMADQCAKYGCNSTSVSLQRAFFTKKTRIISSNCSAEAICRSWPICYCLEKWNWTLTHTHTPNHYNPVDLGHNEVAATPILHAIIIHIYS